MTCEDCCAIMIAFAMCGCLCPCAGLFLALLEPTAYFAVLSITTTIDFLILNTMALVISVLIAICSRPNT